MTTSPMPPPRKLNVPRLTKLVRLMKPVVSLCEDEAAATIVSPLAALPQKIVVVVLR
jgi:hypothetical protein